MGKIAVDEFSNGSVSWFSCLVTNFVSSSSTDEKYMIDQCGAAPSVRPALEMYHLLLVLDYIWPVAILCITFTPDVTAFYWNALVAVSKSLGLDRLAARCGIKVNLTAVKRQLGRATVVSSMSQYESEAEPAEARANVSNRVAPLSAAAELANPNPGQGDRFKPLPSMPAGRSIADAARKDSVYVNMARIVVKKAQETACALPSVRPGALHEAAAPQVVYMDSEGEVEVDVEGGRGRLQSVDGDDGSVETLKSTCVAEKDFEESDEEE